MGKQGCKQHYPQVISYCSQCSVFLSLKQNCGIGCISQMLRNYLKAGFSLHTHCLPPHRQYFPSPTNNASTVIEFFFLLSIWFARCMLYSPMPGLQWKVRWGHPTIYAGAVAGVSFSFTKKKKKSRKFWVGNFWLGKKSIQVSVGKKLYPGNK